MDMNESEQIPGEREGQETWCAAIHRLYAAAHGVAESRTQLSD